MRFDPLVELFQENFLASHASRSGAVQEQEKDRNSKQHDTDGMIATKASVTVVLLWMLEEDGTDPTSLQAQKENNVLPVWRFSAPRGVRCVCF